jgi:hypothetical protein
VTIGVSLGLVPVNMINGAPLTSKFNTSYQIQSGYNTNIFEYDPVFIQPNGYLGKWVPTLTTAGANTPPIVGVFLGCRINLPGSQASILSVNSTNFWPANQIIAPGSTVATQVIDDPLVIYNLTCNGTPSIASIGANANITNDPGSVVSGQSGILLDTTTISKANTTIGSGNAVFAGGGAGGTIVAAPYITNNSVIVVTPQVPLAGTITITKQPGASFTVLSSSGGDNGLAFSYVVNSGSADNSFLPLRVYAASTKTPFNSDGTGTPGMNLNCIINNHAFRRGTQGM